MGPDRAAARLETDKAFCREMMVRHGIAGCPFHRTFHEAEEAVEFIRAHPEDLVIKPIGLTGGKGVRIMGEHLDSEGAVAYVRKLRGKVVLEERLIGEEFTLQAFSDGLHLVPLPLVQDHKRAYEGDTGPNTGGMGSYSLPDHRLPFVTEHDYTRAFQIMRDVIASMRREGHPFKGILYGQFMNTGVGPRVVEFNARFGDPEAMNVLPLLTTDFADILCHIGEGGLAEKHVRCEPRATVCKYVVPEGYPDAPVPGEPLELGRTEGALVYYANIEERDGRLYTLTSRTLAFVGVGDSLARAENIAETAAKNVRGRVFHRTDIGTPALLEKRIAHMQELR
jgi:phosphoribosylamine--glycine ligase